MQEAANVFAKKVLQAIRVVSIQRALVSFIKHEVTLVFCADECAPGRFGPSCTLCSSCPNGTCEEGITGAGRCIPLPLKPAAEGMSSVSGL